MTLTAEELRLIRKRAEEGTEVLAVADRRHLLAALDDLRGQLTREDVAPFFGHGHTSPGYWRLVGPKHYKPIPTPEQMSQEAIDELRRRLTERSDS